MKASANNHHAFTNDGTDEACSEALEGVLSLCYGGVTSLKTSEVSLVQIVVQVSEYY